MIIWKPINFNNTPHHGANNVSIAEKAIHVSTQGTFRPPLPVYFWFYLLNVMRHVMWALYVRVVYWHGWFHGKSWLRKDVCEDGWGLDDVLNMSWSFLRVQQCKTIGRANLSVRMRKIDLSLPLFTSILQMLIFFLMTFFVVCNGSMHENVSSKSIQWVEMHVELEVPIIKSHTLMCMLASVCWCDFKTSSWDQVNIFPTINFETSRRMMAYISLHLLVGKHCSWATNYVIDDLSLMPLTIKKYENMNLTKASKEKPYLICIIYGLFKSLDP